MDENGPRVVVAIDFGTSHSGFAYAHKGKADAIEALYNWENAPMPYPKTLSAILYNKKNVPVAWGYSAQQKFNRLPPAQRVDHKYLTRFKLFLDEDFARNHEAPEDGPIPVIGDYLNFMRITIQDVLRAKFGESLRMENVQWCLTVPAMWTDRAKYLTRKAAAYAGIISEPSSPRLNIILEPEAAALFVSKSVHGSLSDGDVFMILDAGGGTVDLTVHKVRDVNGNLKFMEVAPGHGKSCGSTFVDERFLEYFKQKVGEEAFTKSQQERPEEVVKALAEWESVKRTFKGPEAGNAEDHHEVTIPVRMQSGMSDGDRSRLEKEQDGYCDTVQMKREVITSFFDPVIEEIELLADEMLSRCNEVKVNKILCVGGFSESQYLLKRVRARYEPRGIEVVCPADPGATVVKGAVQFGLNPTAIATRRARLTYGLAVRGYWDPSYPEHKRAWDSYQKTWMVEDKFDKLVTRNEELPVNHVVQRTYYPPAIYSTSIRLSLYATELENPRLIDEPGCWHMAEVVVPLNLRSELTINDYPISISVSFGTTEVTVVATNTRTGEDVKITVKYDDDSQKAKQAGKRSRTPEVSPTANGKKVRTG